jgi:phage/plasmid-like protein (TIGR03299 family)
MNDFTRGTSVLVSGLSVEEQLQAADLNWTVELEPVSYSRGTTKEFYVAYRSDTGAVLDIYKHRHPWQNDEVLEAFNAFAENANIELQRVGSLKEGKRIYAIAKLPVDLCPKGELEDRTEVYLMLEDSHENGKGMTAALWENRLVCTNGMRTKVNLTSRVIPHTSAFNREKVANVVTAAIDTINERQQVIDTLAETAITKAEAMMNLVKAFGNPNEAIDDQPQMVRTCLRLFDGEAKGSEYLSAYNTAYGLLQSVTEYFNHHCGYSRGLEHEFQSILDGSRAKAMKAFQSQMVSVYCR